MVCGENYTTINVDDEGIKKRAGKHAKILMFEFRDVHFVDF